jgi:hypothetical protein
MAKSAVLLIGGVTHVQKEWEECSSFAVLKVYLFYPVQISPCNDTEKLFRNTPAKRRPIS